jgi:hypothetical protein
MFAKFLAVSITGKVMTSQGWPNPLPIKQHYLLCTTEPSQSLLPQPTVEVRTIFYNHFSGGEILQDVIAATTITILSTNKEIHARIMLGYPSIFK